jgi:hypothetical protein
VLQRKNARRTAAFPDFLTPKPPFLVKTDHISAFSSRILKPAPVSGARSGCQPLLDSLAAAPLCTRAGQHFYPEAAGRLSKEAGVLLPFADKAVKLFKILIIKGKCPQILMAVSDGGPERQGKAQPGMGGGREAGKKGLTARTVYYYYYA